MGFWVCGFLGFDFWVLGLGFDFVCFLGFVCAFGFWVLDRVFGFGFEFWVWDLALGFEVEFWDWIWVLGCGFGFEFRLGFGLRV